MLTAIFFMLRAVESPTKTWAPTTSAGMIKSKPYLHLCSYVHNHDNFSVEFTMSLRYAVATLLLGFVS
jgi:hypothetical protein